MTERVLVIDASLSKRLATELENRGKPSRSVGRVANRHLKDPELLPTLVDRLGDEPWVLVTGDDNMPGEHGALVTELRLTIATVDPRWYGSPRFADQEAWKRETVHRWAHRMATQRAGEIRRYSPKAHRLWRPLR